MIRTTMVSEYVHNLKNSLIILGGIMLHFLKALGFVTYNKEYYTKKLLLGRLGNQSRGKKITEISQEQ